MRIERGGEKEGSEEVREDVNMSQWGRVHWSLHVFYKGIGYATFLV